MLTFIPETITFLKDLRKNNNQRWFEENRHIYQTYLLDPFRELATALGPTLSAVSHRIETRPLVNKTISRIYRDTRFSQNKLPLRDHMWLEFRDRSLPGTETPQFFFYLEVEEWGYGMGFWQASTKAMEEIRGRMLADVKRGQKLLKDLQNAERFTLGGEKYKRHRTADLPADLLELYNHKSFYFINRQPIGKKLFSKNLAEEVSQGFQLLGPIYRYVAGLPGNPS